jgi:DinB superfamily
VKRIPGLSLEITRLLSILDQAYDRRSWHGTNLRGSIRGLPLERAAWRPQAGRHNIWELVVHAAYWKYAARRRLTREARGRFPLNGSNWFERPVDVTEDAWRSDVSLLDEMHRSLRVAIASLPTARLHQKLGRGRDTAFTLISGAAAHDLYHAGQIQLLKRLSER